MAKARNAKCSCGSGKKYKLCHGLRVPKQQRRNNLTLIAVGLGILAFAGAGIYSSVKTSGASNGRVWSAEHGHWHDSAGGELGGSGSAESSASNGPGPGKVWSPEHNHWH